MPGWLTTEVTTLFFVFVFNSTFYPFLALGMLIALLVNYLTHLNKKHPFKEVQGILKSF